MSYNHLRISELLCCDGPKTYHKINLTTLSVNQAPVLYDLQPPLISLANIVRGPEICGGHQQAAGVKIYSGGPIGRHILIPRSLHSTRRCLIQWHN